MNSINYVDIGVIILVLLLGIRGLKNGLIHEMMEVIGIVLGIFLASHYCIEVGGYLKLIGLEFQSETILWTLAFILILACIWIVFLVIGSVIAKFVVMIPETIINYFVNYFGGYIFAALKYFIILCILVYALSQVGFLKEPLHDFTKDTKTYPIMYEIAEKIMSLETLQELKDEYEKKQDAINKKIEETKTNIKKQIPISK